MRALFLSLICCAILVSPASPARAGEGHAFRILTAPGTGKQFEIIDFDFTCENVPPFDPREKRIDGIILPPVGKRETIPAYWTQDFSRAFEAITEVDATGRQTTRHVERLKPLPGKAPHWRLRYCPSRPGTYQVELRLVSRKAPPSTSVLWRGSFLVLQSPAKGFLRRNPDNPDYLRFDDGSGYFALGYNICWPPAGKGVHGYLEELDKLREAGGNYTRLWLSTWGFSLETPTPYSYDLAGAWAVEEVFREAGKRGIRIKLCIDNTHDFTNNSDKKPYLVPNGPCRNRKEFFTSPLAREIYYAKLRYLIARYSAFTSLYAWELWNEIDYALVDYYDEDRGEYLRAKTLKQEYYLPWTKAAIAFLRKNDPYNHLRTTSLGLNSVWDSLWSLKGIDIAQLHSYIRFAPVMRKKYENDAALLAINSRGLLAGYHCPTLLAEFGYNGTNDHNPMNERDKDGIALHNALWAGTLCGHSGTPMSWWWDSYIKANGLYYHYQALARFLSGVDWTLPKQALYSDADSQARVMVLADRKWTGIWAQNKAATWKKQLEDNIIPQVISGVTVKLSGYESGAYLIEWIDTYSGKTLAMEIKASANGSLILAVPAFTRDIAGRLRLLKEKERATISPAKTRTQN